MAPQDDGPPPWVDDELPDLDASGGDMDSASDRRMSPALAHRTALAPQANGLADDEADAWAPAATSAPSRVAEPGPGELPALQPTALGQQWHDLLRPLLDNASVAALVRELALQAELIGVQPLPAGGRQWRLRVARETLRNDSLIGKLQAALQTALDEPVELRVEAGEAQDSIARRDTQAREAAQRRAEQDIRSDATVQALMAQFSTARIVPGSVKPLVPPPAA